MIGRAAIGHPWIFREIKHYVKTGEILPPPTVDERVTAARKHLHYSVRWKGKQLGILEMRRHWANYLKGLSHVKEFRMRLVTSDSQDAIDGILNEIVVRYEEDSSLQRA